MEHDGFYPQSPRDSFGAGVPHFAAIDNYLGFPAGISGGELAEPAIAQAAEKFGVQIVVPVEAIALHSRGGSSFRITEPARSFNAEFYVASVTVIPIFFITLAVEVRAASYPIMRRMVALYRYRKLRRFESMRERFHWLIRGMLVALTALLVPVVALGWAAEVIGLLALDKGTIGPSQHFLVLIGVVALPTVVFLWAIAIREREPTPLDEELDRLSRSRRETIKGMSERLHSMERAASRDDISDTAKVRRTRRQLGALTRRDQKLTSSTGKARRSLQTLREHQHG